MLRFGAQIAKISNRRKYPLYGSYNFPTISQKYFSKKIFIITTASLKTKVGWYKNPF